MAVPKRQAAQFLALCLVVVLGWIGLGLAGCSRPSFAREAELYVNRLTRSSTELFRSIAEGKVPSRELLAEHRRTVGEARQLLDRYGTEAGKPAFRAFEQWLASHEEFAGLCEKTGEQTAMQGDDDAPQKQLVERLNSLLRQGAEVRALLQQGGAGTRSSG